MSPEDHAAYTPSSDAAALGTPIAVSALRDGAEAGKDWFVPWRFALVLGLLLCGSFPLVVFGLRTFAFLDFGQFAYPVAFYHHESFWRGELPFWNPLNNCGTPFLAQWNTMTLYPFSLVYLLLPLPWSLSLFCLLHLFLAGLGMYFLACDWTGCRLAGAVAGAVFAFNGFTWYGLIWPHLTAALGWMPWVVLAMDRAQRKGGRTVLVAGLAVGMQLLTGGAEVILFTWLVLAALALARGLRPGARLGPTLRRTFGAAALAMGLAAIQLLPFLDLLAHSQRSSGYANTDLGVMPLTGWANYLVPIFRFFRDPYGLYVPPNHWTASYYLGAGALALALFALWRKRDYRVRVLMGLALFGSVMALGGRGVVYNWVERLLPVLGFLRFPVKFVILATFAIPLTAAFGVAWVEKQPRETRAAECRRLGWLGGVLLAAVAVIVWCAWKYPLVEGTFAATAQNALLRAVFLLAVVGCLVLLGSRAESKSRVAIQIGLVLLVWGDILTHNSDLSPTLPAASLPPDAIRQFFHWDGQLAPGNSRLMESPAAYHRLLSAGFRNLQLDTNGRRLAQFFDFNLLDHTPKVDGFYSLEIKEYSRIFHELYYTTNKAPRLRDFLGVSLVSNPANVAGWIARPTNLPIITAGQKAIFADPTETMPAILSPRFDPQHVVYLPFEAIGKVKANAGANAKILSHTFSAQRVDFEVESDAPTVAVVAQTYYHPWHAYVDGKPTALWRANYAFQALVVPAGRHHVSLRYEDVPFRCGAVLSLATILLCGLLWVRQETPEDLTAGRIEAPTGPGSLNEVRKAVAPSATRRWLVNLGLLFGTLLLCGAGAEFGLRLFCRQGLAIAQDERSLMYQYNSRLGWFPIPNTGHRVIASRPFTVIHNSQGFRGPEPVINQKPGILFLGDSFVWGFDVEAADRFTEKLQARHPEWNVYNLGVSGYGTDQELLLLEHQFDHYKPRVVFLVFCVETDHDDNSANARYNGYYKPYFIVEHGKLELRGVPVPRSERFFLAQHRTLAKSYLFRLGVRAYFKWTAPPVLHNPDPTASLLRQMAEFVRSKGARLLVGLTARDPQVEKALEQQKVPFVDLSTSLRYPGYGRHWTPQGHTFVNKRINEFLARGHYMEQGTQTP